MEHFQTLLFNAVLLIIMGFAYTRIFRFFRQRMIMKQLLNGILFGLIAIAVMACPVYLMPGLIFDTRTIIISISGLFGGPVVVAISALLAVSYRIIQGGVGTITGISTILVSGVIGIGYYYLRKEYLTATKPLYIYTFGLIVHIAMLLCMFILPFDIALKTLESITLPVIIIYPFVSFVIVSLILDKEAAINNENIIHRREKLYSGLLNNLSTGIVIHAPDTQIIFSNPQASKLLGLSIEQMHGKKNIDSAWNFVQEDGSKMPEDKYPVNHVLTTLQPLEEYIIGINRTENDLIWVMVNAFPEFDSDQQLNQIIVTFLDITKSKQTKEVLEASEENLRITLNSIDDGVIATDIDAKVIRMNPEAERLTGWKLSDAAGKPLQEVFNIVNAKTLKTTPVREIRNTGTIADSANRTMLIAKNGSSYQITDSCSSIQDKSGNIAGVVLVFRDMTEDYQMQESVQRSESLLNQVGDIAKVGGWEIDFEKQTHRWTKENYRIHETTPEEYSPTINSAIQFYTPESVPLIKKAIQDAIELGKEFDLELDIITAKGRKIAIHTSSKIIRKNGKTIRMLGAFQDISEQKKAEKDLKSALIQAECASRAKS